MIMEGKDGFPAGIIFFWILPICSYRIKKFKDCMAILDKEVTDESFWKETIIFHGGFAG